MSKVKILYFMPEPAMRRNHGNRTHTIQLLEYFKSRLNSFDVDYMAPKEWEQWDETDKANFHKAFPDFGLVLANRKVPKKNKIQYFFEWKLPKKIRRNKHLYDKNLIDDYTTVKLQSDFDKLLQRKQYDIVIISYVTWARLVDRNPNVKNIKLIVDTHDFMTAQFKNRRGFKLGDVFEREIQLLSLFHEVWSQSYDEQYLFSQFVSAKHRVVPIMYDKNYHDVAIRYKTANYDIIYVASDNPNNQNSCKWFFDNVYPSLPANLKICVVGPISRYTPDLPNVDKHIFVSDLSQVYRNAKIAICPMLEGTGIKVKVVEALSFGLPIVCTLRGLDGLPTKTENGCLLGNTPQEFTHHINRLLTDEVYYEKNSTDGISMFRKFFDKDKCYEYLDEVFEIETEKDEAVDYRKGILLNSN